MEFFVLSGLAFFVSIIFTIYAIDELKSITSQREYNLLKDLGIALQKEALIASSVEDGYLRTFTIPQTLQATLEYSIQMSNTSLSIESAKTAFTASIPQLQGNFSKGANKIEKRDGVVYVNS